MNADAGEPAVTSQRTGRYAALPRQTAPGPVLLALGGLLAMAGGMGIGRFVYTPILPQMVEALGQTKGEAGLVASANFLGYLIGAVTAGRRGLPASPRTLLLAALTASAATSALMAWPSDLRLFLILRLVSGVASAFVLVMASSLVIERLMAAGRGGLVSVHFAGVGTGIALSSLVTTAAAAAGLDWRAMWIAAGALTALFAILVATLIPAGVASATAPPAAGSGSGGRLARLTLAYGLFGLGYVVTATFIVAIVRGAAELRPTEPYVWLVLGLAAIPSIAIWTAIGRRIGVAPAFAAACLVEAAGVAASVVSGTAIAVLAAAALLGGTFMGITALGLMAARQLAPADPRGAVALLTAAFGVGQIVGPAIAGYGFDLTGSFLLPSLLASAALCLAAALTYGLSTASPRA